MANEATIRSSLQISKLNDAGDRVLLQYNSSPVAFNADVSGTNGPTPGAVTVSTTGTHIDLSQLTTPGLARFMNLDGTNFVSYGMWDPDSARFLPLGELLPGESFVLRLSRSIGEEFGTGTGTGTTGSGGNRLHFVANAAACVVLVEVFER